MSRDTGTYDITEELEIQKEQQGEKVEKERQVRLSIGGVHFQDEYFEIYCHHRG